MTEVSVFRFKQAAFDFGDGQAVLIDLVADLASKAKNTHFTLFMGANGTCKSRILSCCVNLLKGIHEEANAQTLKRTPHSFRSDEPDRDIRCETATLMRDGVSNIVGQGPQFDSSSSLPSRVLAIANLVRDRFTFVDWDDFDNPFYYYLGVRQASNLTTTGAMDRLVCDAILKLLEDDKRYSSMSSWTKKLFPESELGLAIPRFYIKSFQRFLKEPTDWIKRKHPPARGENYYQRRLEQVLPYLQEFQQLCDLLEQHGHPLGESGSMGMKRGGTLTLCLDQLLPSVRLKMAKLNHALNLASSLALLGRPSLVLKSKRWLDFTQLSSGEQNILATGARLLAYAAPGSLVVIDEPEVSLNIAWQQRYIDLISDALVHAKGSHVIIASHSPYLISDLRAENSTVVVVERGAEGLRFRSHAGEFWGWGSEAILYEVLGLPSASNYHFSRELAGVLKLVSEKSTNVDSFRKFLRKCDQLDFGLEAEPLKVVIEEIRSYAQSINI